jgi:hypothetical protein
MSVSELSDDIRCQSSVLAKLASQDRGTAIEGDDEVLMAMAMAVMAVMAMACHGWSPAELLTPSSKPS